LRALVGELPLATTNTTKLSSSAHYYNAADEMANELTSSGHIMQIINAIRYNFGRKTNNN